MSLIVVGNPDDELYGDVAQYDTQGVALKKYTKLSAAVAVTASSALLFTACSPGGEPTTDNEADQGVAEGQQYTVEPEDTGKADLGDIETAEGTISVGMEQDFTSYNNMMADNYSTYNSQIADRISGGFNYFGTDGTIYPDEEFGTIEVESEDPLVVKYTINDDAVWSDGTPITAADYIFKWAVENPRTVDSNDETVFTPVSTTFGEYVPNAPEGDPDGKEFTITYDEPYADWQLVVDRALPAHVVAEQSGLSMEELIEAARNNDGDALAEAAEFWNTGWNVTNALPDEALIPSSGPYVLTDFSPGQSVTLTANENYWGTPAATQTLTVRIASADTHVQALQNGDMNAIEPQATVDTLEQLEGLGDQAIVHQYAQMTYEHLDFNHAADSLFGDSYELRQAFALCVPRQQIIDNLIKPLNPDAEVLNAREYFNFQDEYQEVIDYSYDGSYDEVDIEAAADLIEQSGVDTPTVRIGYAAPNPRREQTVSMIKDSCDEAGFDIQDYGAQDFFGPGGGLSSGDWDIALFAWAGSGQIVSGRNISHTDGAQNDAQYSNEDVDAAWDIAAGTVDPEVHLEQRKEVEKLHWDTLYNIPLYTHPGIAANSADIANVRSTATQAGLQWNVEQWVRPEAEAE